MECPICKKEFDEKTGRRPKKFCSDACKVKFWNRKKAGIKTAAVLEDGTKVQFYVPVPDAEKVKPIKVAWDLGKVQEDIKRQEWELENPPKFMSIPMSMYRKIRINKIAELQQQLSNQQTS